MKWIVLLKGNTGKRYTAVLFWWNMWIRYWWKKNVIAAKKKTMNKTMHINRNGTVMAQKMLNMKDNSVKNDYDTQWWLIQHVNWMKVIGIPMYIHVFTIKNEVNIVNIKIDCKTFRVFHNNSHIFWLVVQ